MEILQPTKIVAKQSPIHGLGVFATEDIEKGEVIEECPFLKLPTKRGDINYTLIDYTFVWPKSDDWDSHIISLGYGSLYNHSTNPNANWDSDLEKNVIKFYSTKKIEKGEEIFIYYGDENYWNDGRSHIDVK